MADPLALLRKLGHSVVDRIWRLGYATRFFGAVLMYSGMSFRRLPLTLREIYFSGVLSLLIIMVSGLFVGLVLGLQGYETLQRYGSTEALGVLVALSLTRELGPVAAALLFASRAGSSVTAEIGLMKATEQLKAWTSWRSIRSPASLPRASGVASSRCRCLQRYSRRWACSAAG